MPGSRTKIVIELAMCLCVANKKTNKQINK